MRKTQIQQTGASPAATSDWLDIDRLASVEITSEDELFPIEHALGQAATTGWRAKTPGPQVIRLRFDQPQSLRTISLRIVEQAAERMQELAIYAETPGQGLREVVRQQFTFSPNGSTEEVEEFAVQLNNVATLELRIDPDRSHRPEDSRNYASLASLRLA